MEIVSQSNTVSTIKPATTNSYSLDFDLMKIISNCSLELKSMTPCVKRYYDQIYGSEPNELIKRYHDFALTSFDGVDWVKKNTGCEKPCEKNLYSINLIQTVNSDDMLDEAHTILKETASEFSSLLILSHVPKIILVKYEEQLVYTWLSFISDIGGIMGVFLGLSIWSLYSIFITPFTTKIDEWISSKK